MFGRYPEASKVGDCDGAFAVGRARRRPVIGHRLRPVNPIGHQLLSGWAYRSRAEIGAYILPYDLAISGNLKQAAVHALVDERVTVGQPASTADKGTVEGPLRAIVIGAGVLPDNRVFHWVDFQDAGAW